MSDAEILLAVDELVVEFGAGRVGRSNQEPQFSGKQLPSGVSLPQSSMTVTR